jgi:cyclic pyranopterin phosphate synthase|tara:strand:+ start:3137 stop:4051 length:915 start_codon:yes stop_codon:yes gene_type:complete
VITIYTDGACLGNPGPGGWGAVIIGDGPRRVIHGNDPDTTNNRMEIKAVVEALQSIPSKSEVTVYSDSSYVINTMTKNWKRKKNNDMWDLLDKEVLIRKVNWEWVKGHAGDPLNEEADRLAHGEATGNIDSKKKRDEGSMSGLKEDFQEKLTHVDASGKASMVDVGAKPDTERVAEAVGKVKMLQSTLQLVQENSFEKGDVLAIAKIAGIMGAKQTSNLIPLCHPLPLTHVDISFEINENDSTIEIKSIAKTQSKTGVEMEALAAVSIAALTIYDMCKAVDKGMEMSTKLLSKKGGRSGDIYLG